MKSLCILFLHHADNEVTRHHAALARKLNPHAAFVPLTFKAGLPGALQTHPPMKPVEEWWHADRLIYNWFNSDHRIPAERYVVMEYDTLCQQPFPEFHRQVWDQPAACAEVITPESDPNWLWFKKIPDHQPFAGRLTGMVPLCGILLSGEALERISTLARNYLYAPLYCECRIGTLARTAGFNPVTISRDIGQYINWKPVSPDGPGIWHPVKALTTRAVEI